MVLPMRPHRQPSITTYYHFSPLTFLLYMNRLNLSRENFQKNGLCRCLQGFSRISSINFQTCFSPLLHKKMNKIRKSYPDWMFFSHIKQILHPLTMDLWGHTPPYQDTKFSEIGNNSGKTNFLFYCFMIQYDSCSMSDDSF